MKAYENNLLRKIKKVIFGSECTTYIQMVSFRDLKRNEENHCQLKPLVYGVFTGYLTESDCTFKETFNGSHTLALVRLCKQ